MSKTDDSIGFLGLGALGRPIAENLLASGKTLAVWNRTAEKAEALVAKGARKAETPAAALSRGGIVLTILWDDASLEETVASPGFLEALGDGIHVSMTTVTPETSRRLAALHAQHGSTLVEAPIFGIPSAAVVRQLVVCLAGPPAAKDRVRPLLEAMGASKVFDFGDVGAATATKLIGNYLIVANFALLEEAFAILQASGVDPKPTLEMLTTTFLATPGNQRYAGYLLGGAPRPRSGIPQKDIRLLQRFAAAAKQPTPLADQVRERLDAAR
jgi:3-hydroxyisobutyrate dehydrogenase-like beta-hydroxyacid dehydrogenase